MLKSARSFIGSSCIALAALLAAGCSSDSTPTGSAAEAPESTGPALLTFTQEAALGYRAAGKSLSVPEEGLSVSKLFRPGRSGSMQVEDLEGRGVRDDLQVTFGVGRNSMPYAATISMTVFGNQLSELVLAFEPHGLEFDDPARIRLLIGRQRVDVDLLDLQALLFPFSDVEAYHEHDDTVEGARILSVKTYLRTILGDIETTNLALYDYAVIEVECPGFSRYGWRR